MSYQIAFVWSPDCEEELKKKGFIKQEVYIKNFHEGPNSEETNKNGDNDFFRMKHKPFQFVTTSWWGAQSD